MCRHPYITKLKQKFYINTEKFKQFSMTKNVYRQKSKTEVNESDVISAKVPKFPSHFEAPDLPEFENVRLDYEETASMLNYCRLTDKTITASYNEQLCRWLIALITMLQS